MTNANDAATGYGFANNEAHQEVTGLTKREYFAAMAISSGKSAKESVLLSDELIKLLNDEGFKKINE